MAASATRDKDPMTQGDFHQIGDLMWRHGIFTVGNPYATGGVAVTAATFGFNTLFELILQETGAEVLVFDKTNSKVLLFTADGTQAANASDQSALTCRYIAIGR